MPLAQVDWLTLRLDVSKLTRLKKAYRNYNRLERMVNWTLDQASSGGENNPPLLGKRVQR
jgi:hypothetical protein